MHIRKHGQTMVYHTSKGQRLKLKKKIKKILQAIVQKGEPSNFFPLPKTQGQSIVPLRSSLTETSPQALSPKFLRIF